MGAAIGGFFLGGGICSRVLTKSIGNPHKACYIFNLIVFTRYMYDVSLINPYLTNGFSHHYQLGESTFIVRGVRSDFYF